MCYEALLFVMDYTFVTHYIKTDHLQIFSKFAFLVWINAEFTVEFNGQKAVKRFLGRVMAEKLYTGHPCLSSQFFEKRSDLHVHTSTFNVSVYASCHTAWLAILMDLPGKRARRAQAK